MISQPIAVWLKRLFCTGLMLFVLTISSDPVFAENLGKMPSIHNSKINTFSSVSFIQVGEEITLEELGLESWREVTAKNILNEKELRYLSIRLRNLARYLSGSWGMSVTIPGTNNEQFLQLTDFREPGGSWKRLTAGHTLSLVMQEWKTMRTDGKQPLIDLLVKDDASDTYRPIVGVPLASYCYQLFHELTDNN
ncbi:MULTISPECIES: hypothetical protein [unclassified Microcoleus]|uniref:hypothetical protein n=1 Tax=unclassified Microcoleus TaxID=2642155 RepID=UPI001DF31B71|nr:MULTISPECIES: hypothetical protein [unclassified Microcoleus]MCC3528023.1 hypothetical protein [Microcoleus sp. PH2017_21_RUC_O_A]MCC3540054.1 hypothetical protein [Microcoleus sp. PH2017_22_RUC_O_B]